MTRTPIAVPLPMPSGYGQPLEGRILPWHIAEQRLHSTQNFWLATVRANGAPHVAPVWGVWIEDSVYFSGIPKALWARNISRNPAAVMHLESGSDVLILEGSVDDIPGIVDADLAAAIVAEWIRKYNTLVPDPHNDGMYRLRVAQAKGWSEYPVDATRWLFEASDETVG